MCLSVCVPRGVCVCLCQQTKKLFCRQSCSVDHHVSGCEYFMQVFVRLFVLLSQQNLVSAIVAAIGDANRKLGKNAGRVQLVW